MYMRYRHHTYVIMKVYIHIFPSWVGAISFASTHAKCVDGKAVGHVVKSESRSSVEALSDRIADRRDMRRV
jgi:hypothetical protein